MRILRKFLLLSLLVLAMGLNAGCGTPAAGPEQKAANGQQAIADLTKENPIKANKAEGTVTFLAQVNGKYLYEPTRHGVVFEGGSNGEKAILRGLVSPEPFYNALMEIGAKPSDNMTMENKETTHVAGDALEVTVTWEGASKEYKLDEVIKDSTNQTLAIKFGGNLKNALEYKTGCLICLDSCPVGITSNSAYTYGAVEKRKEVGFTGNKELLPADGTLVTVKLKLNK